jgi:hypothetical protein
MPFDSVVCVRRVQPIFTIILLRCWHLTMLGGSLFTTAWPVLVLRMEGRPPEVVANNSKGVLFGSTGLGANDFSP